MLMICPVDSFESYTFITFADQVMILVILAFPVSIAYTAWRVFVSERMGPRGNVMVLGLDESSAIHSERYRQKIPGWTLLLYFLTSFGTFSLGLLAFDTYQYVKALLWSG